MTPAEERESELKTTPIWQLTQARYQYLRGVKQPHIMEISLVQYSRFSKRGLERYQRERAAEWDASGNCKEVYDRLVWEAYQREEFTLRSEGVTTDAKTAVLRWLTETKKQEKAERLKEAQAENRILSVDDAEIGDRVYTLYGSRYVVIVSKLKKSFKVKDETGSEYPIKAGACQWLHYNELVKAVEEGRPVNPHRTQEPEPDPEQPTPAAAAPIPTGESETARAAAGGAVAQRTAESGSPTPKAGVSRERAEEIIRAEMNKHGLIAAGWTYRFGRACKEFGSCNEKRKILTFSMAIAALNTEDDLREVACHEIAHAKAGNAAGHGPVWRAMARACGANPERICGAHIQVPDNKYHATCDSCGKVSKMTRPPKRVMCCAVCLDKHVYPFMSFARKLEIYDRFAELKPTE